MERYCVVLCFWIRKDIHFENPVEHVFLNNVFVRAFVCIHCNTSDIVDVGIGSCVAVVVVSP